MWAASKWKAASTLYMNLKLAALLWMGGKESFRSWIPLFENVNAFMGLFDATLSQYSLRCYLSLLTQEQRWRFTCKQDELLSLVSIWHERPCRISCFLPRAKTNHHTAWGRNKWSFSFSLLGLLGLLLYWSWSNSSPQELSLDIINLSYIHIRAFKTLRCCSTKGSDMV